MKLYNNWEKNKTLVRHQVQSTKPSTSSLGNFDFDKPQMNQQMIASDQTIPPSASEQTQNDRVNLERQTNDDCSNTKYMEIRAQLRQSLAVYMRVNEEFRRLCTEFTVLLNHYHVYHASYKAVFRARQHHCSIIWNHLSAGQSGVQYKQNNDPLRMVCFTMKTLLSFYGEQIAFSLSFFNEPTLALDQSTCDRLMELHAKGQRLVQMYSQLNDIRNSCFANLFE